MLLKFEGLQYVDILFKNCGRRFRCFTAITVNSSNLLATFSQVIFFLWSEIIFVLVLQYFTVLGNVGGLANLL